MHLRRSCASSWQQEDELLHGLLHDTLPACSDQCLLLLLQVEMPRSPLMRSLQRNKELLSPLKKLPHTSVKSFAANRHGRTNMLQSRITYSIGQPESHVCHGIPVHYTQQLCVQSLQEVGWCMCASPLTEPLSGACCVL